MQYYIFYILREQFMFSIILLILKNISQMLNSLQLKLQFKKKLKENIQPHILLKNYEFFKNFFKSIFFIYLIYFKISLLRVLDSKTLSSTMIKNEFCIGSTLHIICLSFILCFVIKIFKFLSCLLQLILLLIL